MCKSVLCKKANVTISKGVPAKCFIAMGLQKGTKELGCGVDGWYNAYNLTTFVNAGRDSEKASEIAGENISERLSEFKSKPLEFVDFAKIKSQHSGANQHSKLSGCFRQWIITQNGQR